VTGFLLIVLSPERFVQLFSNNDGALMEMAVNAMRINLVMLPVLGFTIVSANYFQAVGKPRQAVSLNLIRQVFLILPLLYLLPRYVVPGLNGVWMAAPTADAISTLLTAGAIFLEVRFLKKNEHDIRHGAQELEQAVLWAKN
ncbi:MAG TPA: MATE family efflux transporter, partial [Firmicutes bacterium]|nr:MATE family efflux transporter [Bacillota bacterium]